MKRLLTVLLAACALNSAAQSANEPVRGRFEKAYWFEMGAEHFNPPMNSRFRVNGPNISQHETLGGRREVTGNGMMLIETDLDLRTIAGARLYLELWGGHPGTSNKRVTLNGRTTYAIPRNGTEQHHCTHLYPTIDLKITDLVPGYNAVQFACDGEDTFWGHFIVENAAIRLTVDENHDLIEQAGLAGFALQPRVRRGDDGTITIDPGVPAAWRDRIARIDIQGHYAGYDENGDRQTTDWHGFTKKREPVAYVGVADEAPFAVTFDSSMLPRQEAKLRAIVHFNHVDGLLWTSEPFGPVSFGPRSGLDVKQYLSQDLPAPFWSRVDRVKQCAIDLDLDPAQIEAAELHVIFWDGGAGETAEPVKLNGQPLDIAGAGEHDVLYRRVKLDPAMLRKGPNTFEVVSDTHHHGIEVLLPGPALMIRTATD